MSQNITHEQIAKRAYEIYLRNGSKPGRDLENWVQAENELKQQPAKSVAVASMGTPAAKTSAVAQPSPLAAVAKKVASAIVGASSTPAKPAARGRKTTSRVKLS